MDSTTEAVQAETETMTTEADVKEGLVESLRATAMLADVTVGVWSGERSDADAMKKLAADAGATGNVGRVIKNLMAGADERLKQTKSAFAAVRAAHRSLTQPWPSQAHTDRLNGPRLLPNILFETYVSTVGAAKSHASQTLETMLEHYEMDKTKAIENLNGMAKEEDYPSTDELRRLFYARIDFEPLPAHTGFTNLPPHFASKLAETLRQKQERLMLSAQDYLWRTLRERVEHGALKFGDPEARFKNTTIEGLVELPGLVRGWNVLRDARADEAASMVEEAMRGVTPKSIRKDDTLRAVAGSRLQDVVRRLDEWKVGKGD